MADDASDPWLGASLGAGRYQVMDALGGGGMGAVYRAYDATRECDVAIKLLHSRLAQEPRYLSRFRREAEVASALAHPHVIRVSDHGEEADGTPWLVMDLVEGESLSQLLKREGRLATARAVRIARQIVSALGAVHGIGVVHRDLKPANVMLTGDATAEHVTVVDFGLARFFDSDTFQKLTMTGQVVGTPTYMAPEQAFGDQVDVRADIYSTGAILCALLTGKPPYGRGRIEEILPRLLSGDRAPLTETDPSLGPIAEVVERCLSSDPDARFASAEALDHALLPFDPTPTTTLVEWSPPASFETLCLVPDPVLDAPRPAARTAFTRALRKQRAATRVRLAEPAAVERSRAQSSPAEPPAKRSRFWFPMLAALAALGGAAVVVAVMTLLAVGEDRTTDAGATLASSTLPVPVAPVSLDAAEPIDASQNAPDTRETHDVPADVEARHAPAEHLRRTGRAAVENAPRSPGVHIAFWITESDLDAAVVRAALVARQTAFADCYEGLPPNESTSTGNGAVQYARRRSGDGRGHDPGVIGPSLARCVSSAFLRGAVRLASTERDYGVSLSYRITPGAETRVTVSAVAPPTSVRVSIHIRDSGLWTEQEVSTALRPKLRAAERCFEALPEPAQLPYTSTIALYFNAAGQSYAGFMNEATHNLGDGAACVDALRQDVALPRPRAGERGQITFGLSISR